MSDLPRLLLCSFDVIPGPSGASRRLTEYLKALPDRFNVVVLSVKTPDHSHIEKYQGARLLRVPVGSGDLASRILAFERAVRRQLDSEEYALVHFTDPFGGYVLSEQKADHGYRLIYEAQTFPSMELRYTHPQTEGDRKLLAKMRRQELFCLMSSDRVVTGSETTRAYIQGLGVTEDSVRVMRAPVDLEPYAPEVLGAPDGSPMRLMYLGSQLGYQGLDTLVRALAMAVRQVDVRLSVVGARHPDWQPHLEELISELGLQQHVEFQPPVAHNDVAKVLALADVGVLPLEDGERNRQQGGPLAKASEYLAAARPVLAADLPITRELLPADATVFHPPGDSEALAERIIELARDVPRRIALGRAGRAFAEQHLDAGLIRGRLLDIYDELLGDSVPVVTAPLQPAPSVVTGTPTNRIPHMAPPGDTPAEEESPAPTAAPVSSATESPAPTVLARREPPPDDLPLLLGQVLDEGLDTRLIKTEPDARPSEQPVVMGVPLRDTGASAPDDNFATLIERKPLTPPTPSLSARPPAPEPAQPSAPPEQAFVSSTLDELLAPTPRAAPAPVRPEPPARAAPAPLREEPAATPILKGTPLPEHPPTLKPAAPAVPARETPQARTPSGRVPTVGARPEPASGKTAVPPPLPSTAARVPSSPSFRLSRTEPVEPPRLTPSAPPPLPSAPPPLRVGPSAPPPLPTAPVLDDEIPEVEAEVLAEVDGLADEEPEEISNEVLHEVQDVDNDAAGDASGADEAPRNLELPGSAMDPWFAQLAYGYCPPEGARFTRHTPPTNFPGRDTEPVAASPSPLVQGSARGKAS